MKARLLFLSLVSLLFAVTPLASFAQRADTSVEVLGSIDYPRSFATSTGTSGISNGRRIVGPFFDRFSTPYSYSIAPSGRYSKPIVYPSADRVETRATGVNTAGMICGYYANIHGFFYDGKNYTSYDVPAAQITTIRGLNDAGSFVGNYSDSTSGATTTGFLNVAGNLTTFTVANADHTTPTGINNLGEMVGYYYNGVTILVHGFTRAADGTITLVEYPGAVSTDLNGINDNGTVVGTWMDAGLINHGLILQLPNTFTSFDIPGAQDTYISGINNDGLIVGSYIDGQGSLHGFLARILP